VLLPQVCDESAQLTQALPALPHAAFSPPGAHSPLAVQQPVRQVVGLHSVAGTLLHDQTRVVRLARRSVLNIAETYHRSP
ncbi:MAG: hypothetical protein ABL886_03925, partial [Rhodoglobus sp.]